MAAVPIARWIRRNLLVIAAAAATMAAVVIASLLILDVADREDTLRDAQTNLAELAPEAVALRAQPVNVVDRGVAARSDVAVSHGLRTAAIAAARATRQSWGDDSRTASILATTERTVALNGTVVTRAVAGDFAGARRALRRLVPTGESLSTQVALARRSLQREIDRRQGEVLGAVLLIAGLAGLALVGLMAGVVTARRRRARSEAEKETLQASENRLQALVRHGSDMITVVGPDTTVLYEAGAVREMLGFEPSEVEGSRLVEWVHADDAAEVIALCASADDGSEARELRFHHRDGSLRTCEARATSLLGSQAWDGIVLNIWDVSERKELEERLRHQAFHDGLTGLANRALFADRLEHALLRGARSSHPVTVLLVDLDDFKAINDSFGHAAGDRLLKEVSARLRQAMRAADTVARLGGDEFAVILDEAGEGAESAVGRVFAAVEEPFAAGGRTFPVSASVGVATSVPGRTGVEQLTRNADLAMYAAKAQGKGRWKAYSDEMYIAAEERLRLKADFAHAVAAGDQMQLVYQPVVDLESDEIVGMEALLRWNHPTRGEVQPEEFIPLAEESGAIVEVGRRVLHEACRQGREWSAQSGTRLGIAVNVSARQICRGDLVADVRQALADSGLPAGQLLLEITESQLMRNREEAVAVLSEIKELGVKIAIDDFGTGYSSLSQLEQLPVDVLKVDRNMARVESGENDHAKLLQAVVEIGRTLHLRTVVEGIETPGQLSELSQLHFSLGQGFLFARPMPAAQITAMLAGQKSSNGHRTGPIPPPVLQPSAK